MQEKCLGKLDRDVAHELDHLARGRESHKRLKSGTMLVREQDGIMHEVVIVRGDYLWNEETYKSLSAIAKRITGTSWNGPRFFGLRQKVAEGVQHA